MNVATASESGLRDRTRRAVRSELITVAMDLFVRQGFDATTVDQIVAAAGISRRSFFRYFASKEEVVLSHLADLGVALVAALTERPAAEDAWTALRRAFDVLLADTRRDPQRSLSLMHMLDGTAALKARYLAKQLRWQDLLILHVAARLDPAPTAERRDPRPAAIVGAALACLEAAHGAWMATDGQAHVGDLLDDAMRSVRPGSF